MSRSHSAAKARIRQAVWDRLRDEKIARFPFPPHGRIPNFAGARLAAERLFELPELAGAKRIKVNPDSPQRYVRLEALRRGIEVYTPTPRLRAGFRRTDPGTIDAKDLAAAASLSRGARFSQPVALDALPELDALVVGCVAVSRDGRRCGKGEGYADLEYGILRSLGQPPLPVFTTVADEQIVEFVPGDPTDLPVCAIATPTELYRVAHPPPAPAGIDWSQLTDDDLAEMPVLAELRDQRR